VKAIVVDAVPHVLGGVNVAPSRTQNVKVRVSDAPKKTDDDTIHQAREGTAVTQGSRTLNSEKIDMASPILRPLCKHDTVSASGLMGADIFHAGSADGVERHGGVVLGDDMLHQINDERLHEPVHLVHTLALVRRILFLIQQLADVVDGTIVATNSSSKAKATTMKSSDDAAKVDGMFVGLQPKSQNCIVHDTGRNFGGENSLRISDNIIGTLITRAALNGVFGDFHVCKIGMDRDNLVWKLITVHQLKVCAFNLGDPHFTTASNRRRWMICETVDVTRMLRVTTEGKGHGR